MSGVTWPIVFPFGTYVSKDSIATSVAKTFTCVRGSRGGFTRVNMT